MSKSFHVIAGKYEEDYQLNCKYSHDFDTLDEAIAAYDSVSGYPWAYIEYDGRVIELWQRGTHPLH